MGSKRFIVFLFAGILVAALAMTNNLVYAWDPVPVKEDPLLRMPGSQPDNGVRFEPTKRCLNCHAGYFKAGEPGFNWQGSMMAHAARDPIFWTTMVVAAQDSIWAVGRPNATDICLRCHMPRGWLEGRSDPTNASAMIGSDFDGVECNLCHRMYDPFSETTYAGIRELNDWLNYWDETNSSNTPSQQAADTTLAADRAQADAIDLFNGNPFFTPDNLPHSTSYTENSGGQFFVSTDTAKRASFADAKARHKMLYSRYHKSKFFCSTCHDVSNPVLKNLLSGFNVNNPPPGDGTTVLPTESQPAFSYFHVERTFSEFMLSAYGQPGGADGIGPYAPDVFTTSYANNKIAKCQDCHMRDVVGRGANKPMAVLRPMDSLEHPNSGLPLHDLTGGNIWVPYLLASAVPGSPNHDTVNEELLAQGAEFLTMELSAGQGVNPEATLAGMDRAKQQLQLAAAIENVNYNAGSGELSFRVQNHTGHKLISGFPEGRRMFVNIKALDENDNVIYEVNPYDKAAATLKGLDYSYQGNGLPAPQPLAANETHEDRLVYEAHMTSSITGENSTFYFALATERKKDNRIPPKGFDISQAAARLVQPVWDGQSAPDYFTAAEYAGGYDEETVNIAPGANRVEVSLYYQTTSREYMEFLRNEIAGSESTTTLSSPTPSGETEAYITQTDPFFARLKAWGSTMWNLWVHNREVAGAAPYLMAQASVSETTPCSAPVPTMLTAVPSNQSVSLSWSDEHAADPLVVGYSLYYDQAGKAQLIDGTLSNTTTTYVDSGLQNGIQICYKVSSRYADCESSFSNILCAVPDNKPVIGAEYAADAIGHYVTSGKGKDRVTVFEPTNLLTVGDAVVIRATVLDGGTSLPVENATVDLAISGPTSVSLTTEASDNKGIAEAIWQTTASTKKGQGGTTPTGSYTVTIKGVTMDGYAWDMVEGSTTFILQR